MTIDSCHETSAKTRGLDDLIDRPAISYMQQEVLGL